MSKLRVTVSYRFAIIALSLIMASSLTACKADSNYFAATNASIGGSDGNTSDGTAGFKVKLKAKTGVDAFIHKFGDVTAACEIPLSGVGTPTSIQCMVNMMEYDLWFYGLEYEFNVPKETCEFVTVDPNFHYDAMPGTGPSAIVLNTLNGAITSCTIDGVAGALVGGVCSGPEGFVTPTGGVKCAYDYSSDTAVVSGPNCCSGRARVALAASTFDPVSSTTTVVNSVVSTPFLGGAPNCKRSPHDYLDSAWPQVDYTSGAKKANTFITELGKGALVRTTKIPSTYAVILQKKLFWGYSNFLNAGFHDWATYVANPATWDTARTIPRAFQPLYDFGPVGDHDPLTASPIDGVGDGSEDFRCLTGAGEVKLRIRMYTNEWNTIEDYTAYKAGGTASGASPTVRGVSGVNCSAVNTGPTCNTVWGFEDMLNEFAGGLDAYEFPELWNRQQSPP